MLYSQTMKTLLLALLFSLSSVSFASSYKDYYSLDAPENTALFVAIATGDFEKAEKLLKAGVSPNKKNVKGATAIHALALNDDEEGSIEFLPTLIKYNADINNQDEKGNIGLILAIIAGKYELLYSLIQNGADIHKLDSYGFNILHTIAKFCDSVDFQNPDLKKSLNFIFSKVDQEFIDTAGGEEHTTPLHLAVDSLNLEFIHILNKKADLNNIPNIWKQTPVIITLLDLNSVIFDLATNPQDINPDKIHEVQTLSEISNILLTSLDSEDLGIGYRNDKSRNITANTILSDIEQNLTYIKNHRIQIPQLSSLYSASKRIRDYLSQS